MGRPIAEVMKGRENNKDAILIGPEGGFDSKELKYIRDNSFVTPAVLGRRLVRAETAAISSLSIWQALAGEWRMSHVN